MAGDNRKGETGTGSEVMAKDNRDERVGAAPGEITPRSNKERMRVSMVHWWSDSVTDGITHVDQLDTHSHLTDRIRTPFMFIERT